MISSRFFSTGQNLRSALSQEIESSTANPPPQAVSEKAPAQTRAAPAEDSRKPLISGSGLRAASGSSSTGPLRVGAAGTVRVNALETLRRYFRVHTVSGPAHAFSARGRMNS